MEKSLVLLACVFVGAQGLNQALIDEKREKIMEYALDCMESEKATDADLEAMKAHKPPVTHEGRCVIFCVNKKLGVMSEDGSITVPNNDWVSRVKADDIETFGKMEKAYNTCAEIDKKDDPCDTSLEFVHCLKGEAQKNGLDKLFTDGE